MIKINCEYEEQCPLQLIQARNHESRNVITSGLTSVAILKKYLDSGKLTSEQIQKHLDIIEQSFEKELQILEQKNKQIEEKNIVIFKKKCV
jgi:hypothetical protein